MLSFVVGGYFFITNNNKIVDKTRVGFVVPIKNNALEKIEKAFLNEIDQNCCVDVKNAMGDQILQYNILKDMVDKKYDYIVTIGSSSGQSAIGLCQKNNCSTHVIALAAKLLDKEFASQNGHKVLSDELEMSEIFEMLLKVVPDLKKMAMIYSSAEKSIEEANIMGKLASENDVNLLRVMIQNLAELNNLIKTLDDDLDLIFVPKDLLVTSGIQLLIKKATQDKIMLIVSDEGSVQEGAPLGFGVSEYTTGKVGAQIINKLLNAEQVPSINIIKDRFFFINPQNTKHFFDVKKLISLAAKNHILISSVEPKNKG